MLVLVGCGASAPPAPVLRVEAVGTAPQLLRYAPRPHVPEHFELAYKRRSKVKVNTEKVVDWPTVKVIGTMEATRVDASGAEIELIVTDVRVLDETIDPSLRSEVESSKAKLVGARATWHRSPTGNVTHEVIAKELEDMLPTGWDLPVEPVGVGARWQVVETKREHIEWKSTTSYELLALENRIATLRVHVDMRAGAQDLSVEPGETTRLHAGSATTEIEVRVPLDRLVIDGSGIAVTTYDTQVTRRDLVMRRSSAIEEFYGMKPCAAQC